MLDLGACEPAETDTLYVVPASAAELAASLPHPLCAELLECYGPVYIDRNYGPQGCTAYVEQALSEALLPFQTPIAAGTLLYHQDSVAEGYKRLEQIHCAGDKLIDLFADAFTGLADAGAACTLKPAC